MTLCSESVSYASLSRIRRENNYAMRLYMIYQLLPSLTLLLFNGNLGAYWNDDVITGQGKTHTTIVHSNLSGNSLIQ